MSTPLASTREFQFTNSFLLAGGSKLAEKGLKQRKRLSLKRGKQWVNIKGRYLRKKINNWLSKSNLIGCQTTRIILACFETLRTKYSSKQGLTTETDMEMFKR